MAKLPPIPDVSDTLLTYLNYIYPNELPTGTPDLYLIARLQGAQEVIRHLERLRKKQSGIQPT